MIRKVLAIDWGLKNTGAALGESGYPIQTLPNIDSSTRQKLLNSIDKLVQDYNANTILIGFPSTHIQNAKKVRRIKEMLENKGYKVVLWEETLTSEEARKKLTALNYSKKSIQKNIHSTSAAIMLEEYLDL